MKICYEDEDLFVMDEMKEEDEDPNPTI